MSPLSASPSLSTAVFELSSAQFVQQLWAWLCPGIALPAILNNPLLLLLLLLLLLPPLLPLLLYQTPPLASACYLTVGGGVMSHWGCQAGPEYFRVKFLVKGRCSRLQMLCGSRQTL